MRMRNTEGQAVYYNLVEKHGNIRYVVKSITGHAITGRDRQKRQSRSFAKDYQAEAWLKAHGYIAD